MNEFTKQALGIYATWIVTPLMISIMVVTLGLLPACGGGGGGSDCESDRDQKPGNEHLVELDCENEVEFENEGEGEMELEGEEGGEGQVEDQCDHNNENACEGRAAG